MHQLKQRLLETEAQMTRILQAMETVTDKMDGGGLSEQITKVSYHHYHIKIWWFKADNSHFRMFVKQCDLQQLYYTLGTTCSLIVWIF